PLMTALVTEIRTVGLAWETLSAYLGDTVAEHGRTRQRLANERDRALTALRRRNKDYGRASATIGELRGQLAWMRDRKFDEANKRGAAVADLVATRHQADRQSETIRRLINKVRELDSTFDDTTLDALLSAPGEGR